MEKVGNCVRNFGGWYVVFKLNGESNGVNKITLIDRLQVKMIPNCLLCHRYGCVEQL